MNLHKLKKPVLIFSIICSLIATQLQADEDAAERQQHADVTVGNITTGEFDSSEIFPGTTRKYSVYVPAQYSGDEAANLMVFMDGLNYAKPEGAFRVPIVFDNLIAQKEMPVTIAVFVNPGTIPALKSGAADRSNRSFEYDSLGDRYATFLIDEFLPVALKGYNVSTDPKRRCVCGISSGGICAFTVAWERPDQFGKVVSHIGSFTNIRGGWAYPGLIRKSGKNPKPIEVYLQDGENDLSNLFGDWPLANRDMDDALQFAGYQHKFVMTGGGHSGEAAGKVFPDAIRWIWSDNKQLAPIINHETSPAWTPHIDAVAREDVPHGKLETMPPFESKIFAGTTRDWSVYVPAQYKADKPAVLMVFQDGKGFADLKGRWRVPIVFDNLIARGDMPLTIAVFINPGDDNRVNPNQDPKKRKPSNRSYEYDSLGDRYSRFLLEEILPIIEAEYNIATDPAMRAIGGSSSGGICAFTVAWEHPESFQKVYTNVGSFTNLRGGNAYPYLVRKTEPKPIRITMTETTGDIVNAFGSWPLANQMMASSLHYMGYDSRLDWTEGYKHGSDYGGLTFPDAMKWLWRAEKFTPMIDTKGNLKGDLTLLNLLVPSEDWKVVQSDVGFADAPCSDIEGNFYFSDMKAPAVYKIEAKTGKQTELVSEAFSGLEFGGDGVLYGCQAAKQRVVAIDVKSGEIRSVADHVTPNDMAIAADGSIYITQTEEGHINRIDPRTHSVTLVDVGIKQPNGIAISNDGGTLAVSDYGSENVWTYRIKQDGTLDAKMPTMTLRLPIDYKSDFKFNAAPPYQIASHGDGMTVDKIGRYYVASELGVQIFDPTGRLCGVLPKPDPNQPLTSCTLAGSQHNTLYITNGSTIYSRVLSVEN